MSKQMPLPIVWSSSVPIKSPPKAVLNALGRRASLVHRVVEGQHLPPYSAFPSLETLSYDAGYAKPTVLKAIKFLADCGLITVTKRRVDGKVRSNLYVLQVHHEFAPFVPGEPPSKMIKPGSPLSKRPELRKQDPESNSESNSDPSLSKTLSSGGLLKDLRGRLKMKIKIEDPHKYIPPQAGDVCVLDSIFPKSPRRQQDHLDEALLYTPVSGGDIADYIKHHPERFADCKDASKKPIARTELRRERRLCLRCGTSLEAESEGHVNCGECRARTLSAKRRKEGIY